MTHSAFGVDHSISKRASFSESATDKEKRIKSTPSESNTKKDKDFRPSVYQGVNPRSNTYVRRGTMPERIARPVGGSIAASPANLVVPVSGPVLGGTWGRTRNLQTGDTRAYNKKTGRKAGGYLGSVDIGGYNYPSDAKLKARADMDKNKK